MRSCIGLVKTGEGLHTLESLSAIWKVKPSTAVQYLAQLRKEGHVKTQGGGKQPRLYSITPYKQLKFGHEGFYNIINRYSQIKIRPPYAEWVMGTKYTVEEVLVKALQTKDYRVILASLDLFRWVKNWPRLYQCAKSAHCVRKVGALYDLARDTIRVRRIDKRILTKMMHTPHESRYIIPSMRSKEYNTIEKKWGVFIPFNKQDLERYHE